MAISDNLVSYWSLDEASGNAIDAHSTNDLAETSGTIAAATGKISGARDFEAGDTEYFSIAENAELITSADPDFTITCWINLEAAGQVSPVVFHANYGVVANGWQIWLIGPLYFSIFHGTGTRRDVSSTITPTPGTWYFVAAGHDSVNNVIFISVNAAAAKTTAHTEGQLQAAGVPFRFGGGASTNDYYDGLLDEVGFWKRVLTADEITWLYNSGNGRSYADIVPAVGTIIPLIMHHRKLMMAA